MKVANWKLKILIVNYTCKFGLGIGIGACELESEKRGSKIDNRNCKLDFGVEVGACKLGSEIKIKIENRHRKLKPQIGIINRELELGIGIGTWKLELANRNNRRFKS